MAKVFVALTWEPALMTPDLLCAVFETEERAWMYLLPEDVTTEEFYDIRRAFSEWESMYGDEEVTPDIVGEFFEDDPEPEDFGSPEHDEWFNRTKRRAMLMRVLPDCAVFEMDTESKDPWTMVIGQGSFM